MELMHSLHTERTPRELFLVRDIILKRNGYENYKDFLKSEYWRSIKKKVLGYKYLERYSKCWICGSKDNIHLHHENYRWMLTKFELRSIRAYCKDCHSWVHEIAYLNDVTFSKAHDIIKDEEANLSKT